jgi:hypothetical protein
MAAITHNDQAYLSDACARCDEGDILSRTEPRYVVDTCPKHGKLTCYKYQTEMIRRGALAMARYNLLKGDV